MKTLDLDVGRIGMHARVLEPRAGAGTSWRATAFEPGTRTPSGTRADRPPADQLVDAVSRLLPLIGRAHTVAIGSTGFSGLEDRTALDALSILGIGTAMIANDSVTSYLGELGDLEGTVVAASTSVVTLAVSASTVSRVDGRSDGKSDSGSEYWFEREALDAALRAYEGRGPATALLKRLKSGFHEVQHAYFPPRPDVTRVHRIASFGRWMADAEAQGDAVAADNCCHGGRELALLASASLNQRGIALSAPTQVRNIGSGSSSPVITCSFLTELRALRPTTKHLKPRGDGLDGAARLPTLDYSSALTTRVTRLDLKSLALALGPALFAKIQMK